MSKVTLDDLQIDKYHLDEECRNLPSVIGKYHELSKEKQDELNQLEIQLQKEEAVARKDARRKFNESGIKPTMEMISDELTTLTSLIELREKTAGVRTELGYIKGILSGLDAKKSSLSNLVNLYIKDYYLSKTDEKGVAKEADVKHRMSDDYDDIAEKQTRGLASAMKRRF